MSGSRSLRRARAVLLRKVHEKGLTLRKTVEVLWLSAQALDAEERCAQFDQRHRDDVCDRGNVLRQWGAPVINACSRITRHLRL
jgi:hypothetical protein